MKHSLNAFQYFWLTIIFAFSLSKVGFCQCDTVASCSPSLATDPSAGALGSGIRTVSFGSLRYTGAGASAGYVNNYCNAAINIIRDRPYNFTVTTGPNFNENLRVYIDLNVDNVFDAVSEQVYAGSGRTHRGSFTLPSSVPLGRKIRIRFVSDRTTNGNIGPCFAPQIGQGVDFSLSAIENTLPPVARLSVPDSVVCSPTVSFTDESINAPTSWLWYFGDGDSSIEQSPVHTYLRNGTYSIRLVIQNPYGSNTLVKNNFLILNDTVPAANICAANASSPCCGYGISNLRLLTINTTGYPSSVNYQDFTCRARARVVPNGVYQLSFTGSPTEAQDSKVWLDANNDGEFLTSELIGTCTNSLTNNFRIVIPANALLGIPLRLRVGSDFTGSDFTACNGMIHGKYQDFSLIVSGFSSAPEADFSTLDSNICNFTKEFFYTGTVGGTQYQWTFGDGLSETTLFPAITHTYRNPGSYTVRLIVTNSFGADTVIKTNYVKVYGSVVDLTANCIPTAASNSGNFGITRIRLNTLDVVTTNSGEVYRDLTCKKGTFITPGVVNNLIINFPSGNMNYLRAYIDYNNNGRFDSETILSTNSTLGTVTVGITPALNVLLNTPIRVRIVSASNSTFNACSNLAQGQVIDFVVVAKFPDRAPVAKFGSQEPTNCLSTFQFQDSSLYLPTTYAWTFGNNLGTSTLANPRFTFPGAGLYAVKLVVRNAFGADSLTRINYIRVLPSNSLRAATCFPTTSSPQASTGILTVRFLRVNSTTSDSREGYLDLACTRFDSASRGDNITMQVVQNANAGQLAVWADWDTNGTFTNNELVLSDNGTGSFTGTFRVPNNAPSARIRVRVSVDFSNISDPCANTFGQAEDYAIDVRPSNRAPIARFGTVYNACEATVSFIDSSAYEATSWLWDFGDNTTSTERNPTHTYLVQGNYQVSLTATNSFGSNTVTLLDAVQLSFSNAPRPISCRPQPTNANQFNVSGIYRVQLANIDHSSMEAFLEGYQDNSCVHRAILRNDSSYALTITTNNFFDETVIAWVDWNNDASFDLSERILVSTAQIHNLDIRVPSNAVLGTNLRFRIRTDNSNFSTDACSQPFSGQVEDYGIYAYDPVRVQPLAKEVFSLFPNPASNKVNLKWDANKLAGYSFEVSIIELSGKQVRTYSQFGNSGQAVLDISGLAKGFYLLQVKTNGAIGSYKLQVK